MLVKVVNLKAIGVDSNLDYYDYIKLFLRINGVMVRVICNIKNIKESKNCFEDSVKRHTKPAGFSAAVLVCC